MCNGTLPGDTLTCLRVALTPELGPDRTKAFIAAGLSAVATSRDSEPTSPYFGIAAAARYAATSRWTVGRWLKAGRLKAARIGGVIRIRRADLDALLTGEADHTPN